VKLLAALLLQLALVAALTASYYHVKFEREASAESALERCQEYFTRCNNYLMQSIAWQGRIAFDLENFYQLLAKEKE